MERAATKKTTRRTSVKKKPVKTARAGRTKKPTSTAGETDGHNLPVAGNTTDENWQHRLANHRRRQASVSTILDQTFGRLAVCNPELWERRAYLMLVGLVYERLALQEDEISTEELISLSKALAENRRVELNKHKLRQCDDTTQPQAPGDGKLPKHFADTVRQIYGLEPSHANSCVVPVPNRQLNNKPTQDQEKKVERAGKPNSVPP